LHVTLHIAALGELLLVSGALIKCPVCVIIKKGGAALVAFEIVLFLREILAKSD